MPAQDYPDWMISLGQTQEQYDIAGPVTLGVHPTLYFPADVNGFYQSPMSGYQSYEVTFTIAGSASSTTPFTQVNFAWFADPVGVTQLAEEIWSIGIPSGSGVTVYGSGPVKAAYLQICLINQDASFTQTLTNFVMVLNTRSYPAGYPDWHTVKTSSAIPGYTSPTAGNIFDGVLGYWTGSVPASGTVSLMGSLFNGAVQVGVSVSGTSPELQVQPEAYIAGYGIVNIDQFFVVGTNANSESWTTNWPRCPVIMKLTNNSATNSVTYGITAIAAPTT
jgi:hypothetical protein